MKLIYICSPYRAADRETLRRNIAYAKELTRTILMRGDCPVTPHLYITKCLDERSEEERKIGLAAAMDILRRCDGIVIGMEYGISEGMAKEIQYAKKRGMPIECRERIWR